MDIVVTVIVAIVTVVLFGFVYSLCRAAGNADREIEQWFEDAEETERQ